MMLALAAGWEARTVDGKSGTLRASPTPRIGSAAATQSRLSGLWTELCGERSILFVGMMLLRVIWVVVQTVRSARDFRYAVIGAGIFLAAIAIASPNRRLRVGAVGVMCALTWSYALASPETLGSPELGWWPVLLLIGAVAAGVELTYSCVDQMLEASCYGLFQVSTALLTLVALLLQAVATLIFVAPMLILSLKSVLTYGGSDLSLVDLVPLIASLPPVAGEVIYATFMLRRMRRTAGAPIR
jgi:hypothetical protein